MLCMTSHLCQSRAVLMTYNLPQCVRCVACGRWFHPGCFSDHQSTSSHGRWKCVDCTKCLSCKTTSPGKVGASYHVDCKIASYMNVC